jgi:SAM-dependent methyltransferase
MTTFDDHVRQWQEWKATPWGRIRFAVVRHTLTRELGGRGPLRVLDVGGGDGGDAIPLAAAGHDVTIVDPSGAMLAVADGAARDEGVALRTVRGSIDDLPTGFDAVLCHFVLQYRPDPAADLARLVAAAHPGGQLSIIAPNPVGAVLGRLVRSGPAAALEELTADTGTTVTFAQEVCKITDAEMREHLTAAGCEVVARYGGRCANDLVADDAAKWDPAFYADLERLEIALCDREPFRRLGQFWQLVATTGSGKPRS